MVSGQAFTPSATKTYTLTGVDATTGCSDTDKVVVTVNALPSVSAGADVTTCAGSSVTLTAGGASTYSWQSGASTASTYIVSPSTTTTYTVTGTLNGCTNSDQVVVTVTPLPSVNAGADFAACAGSSITLSATGAS